MIQKIALAVLLMLGAVWTGIWLGIVRSVRFPLSQSEVSHKTERLRQPLLYIMTALVLAVFAASLPWLPYRFVRVTVEGPPAIIVHVTGVQWAWTFSRNHVPAGVPVEFDVTSKDVNHGFGLYGPGGNLVAQTQAMPGYTNRLVVTLRAGAYTVRCLELCGVAHFTMESQITAIKGTGSS